MYACGATHFIVLLASYAAAFSTADLQVVPSEVGQQKLKPYFFLLPSYWRARRAAASDEKLLAHLLSRSVSGGANGNGADANDDGSGGKGIAVTISDLRKTYAAADGTAKQVGQEASIHS